MLFSLYTPFFMVLFIMSLLIMPNLKGNITINLIYSLNKHLGIGVSLLPMNKLFFTIFFIITLSALFFSQYYMSNSPTTLRFFFIKMSFVISMILLILGKTPLVLFLGWDGLGISSFCLILFFLNLKSQNSGLVTIMTNRLGDSLFLLFMIFLFSQKMMNFKLLLLPPLICWIFFILVLTKSAQYPFTSWLPLAMAAPTPISALVHSSTLVAAGIYLLMSNLFLIETKSFLWSMFLISSITAILSGFNSLVETDMKKIIALSTLNQLSFIFLTTSINFTSLAFFHLLSHAIFKSLLFFNGGVIIHFWMNSQEYRKFNSSLNYSWALQLSIFVSLMNLMGLTFFSGFFSKDLILETFENHWNSIFVTFFFLMFFFTFFYCFRFFTMVLRANSKKNILILPQKELMWVCPILFMSLLSMVWGDFFFKFLFFSVTPLNMSKLVLASLILITLMIFTPTSISKFKFSFFSSMFSVSKLLETLNVTNNPLETLKFSLETGVLSSSLLETKKWLLSPLFSLIKPSTLMFPYLLAIMFLVIIYFWFKVLKMLFYLHKF